MNPAQARSRRELVNTLRVLAFAATSSLAWVAEAAPPSEASSSEADTTSAPGEQDPDRVAKELAKTWFERGMAEAQATRYVSAAEAFDRSYEAIAAANTLFNAAWAYEHGGDLVRATERYRSYLARYPDQADAAEVTRALARLEGEVSELRVVVRGATAPAEIRVGDKTLESGAPPILLMPGEVQVVVRDAEGRERIEAVTLRPGQRRSVEIVFAPRPNGEGGDGDGDGDGEGPQPGDGDGDGDGDGGDKGRVPPRWAKPAMWTGVTMTGVGLVGVATFGPLTLREAERFDAALCENPCPEGSTYPQAIEDRWRAYKITTNVMVGVMSVGAVYAITAGAFAFAGRKQKRRDAARGLHPADRRRWRVDATAGGWRLRF